jgi:superfamily II DNA/RNA helicase
VATDVAARGLDISNLPYVVNYDMPGTREKIMFSASVAPAARV